MVLICKKNLIRDSLNEKGVPIETDRSPWIHHFNPEDGDRRFLLYVGNLYHSDKAPHPDNITTSTTHVKSYIYIYMNTNVHECRHKFIACTTLCAEIQNYTWTAAMRQ
jgi:hypothetical protein